MTEIIFKKQGRLKLKNHPEANFDNKFVYADASIDLLKTSYNIL